MSTAILPGKFDGGDIITWLREFDACAEANGWNAEAKLKKLPAFLRGQAASHFYALDDESRGSYAVVVKALKEAMCPPASREVYFSDFETRWLKAGEDPSVYKWELEQILLKADPEIDEAAKTALLTRQFMKGIPKNIRIKLLENDPAPSLAKMVSFVQRYRAIRDYSEQSNEMTAAGVASEKSGEITKLVAMVSDLATRQKVIEEKLSTSEHDSPPASKEAKSGAKRNITCFVCNKMGHIARECWFKDQTQSSGPRMNRSQRSRCHECQGYGHYAKDCANRLNSKGATR